MSAKTPSSSTRGSLSSFHRMEALVFSDTSNRFSEWPTDIGPKDINFHSDLPLQVVPYPDRGSNGTPVSSQAVRLLKHRMASPLLPVSDSQPAGPRETGQLSDRRRLARDWTDRPLASKYTGPVVSFAEESEDSALDAGTADTQQEYLEPVIQPLAAFPVRQGDTSDNLHLLGKAEKLLNAVKQSIRSSSGKRPLALKNVAYPEDSVSEKKLGLPEEGISGASPDDDEIYRLLDDRYVRPPLPASKCTYPFSNSSSNTPGGDLFGIQWLLAGLPDVYSPDDQEDCFSDEVVDRLLKEGGPTPAELIFPSLYEQTQQKLNKLGLARRLRLCLSNLHVYSTRCGLRKNGSFVLITPPCGTMSSSARRPSCRLDLDELEDSSIASTNRTNQRRHVNVLHEYFVGSVELNDDKKATWDILLTNEVVNSWLSSHCGTRPLNEKTEHEHSSSIRVEFFSLLRPKSDKALHVSFQGNDPYVRIGFLDIPMCGLLGAADMFDVVVSSEIALDADSNAVVSSRLDRLPTGGRGIGSTGASRVGLNGQKMGSLSARVQLLTEKNAPLYINDSSIGKNAEPQIPAMMNSRNLAETIIVSPSGQSLTNASEYVPTEAKFVRMPNVSFVGVAVHSALINSNDIYEHITDCASFANIPQLPTRLNVSVEYKIAVESGSIRKMVSSGVSLRQPSQEKGQTASDLYTLSFEESQCSSIFEVADISKWRPLLFEIWIEWVEADILANNNRKLFGIAKFSEITEFHSHIRLPVRKLGIGSILGLLDLSCHLSNVKDTVQRNLTDSIARSRVSDITGDDPSVPRHLAQKCSSALDLHLETVGQSLVEDSFPGTPSEIDPSPRQQEPPLPIRQTASPVREQFTTENSKSSKFSGRDEIQESTDTISTVSETELLGLEENASRDFDNSKRHVTKTELLPLQRRRLAHQLLRSPDVERGEISDPFDIENRSDESYHNSGIAMTLNEITPANGSQLSRRQKILSHELDIAICGTALDLSTRLQVTPNSTANKDSDILECMGFFVFYEFPNSIPSAEEKLSFTEVSPPGCENCYTMWWDKQCAILNGHRRHFVDLNAASNLELKFDKILEGLSAHAVVGNQLIDQNPESHYIDMLKEKLGIKEVSAPAVFFSIVPSDVEGALQRKSPFVASGYLTGAQLLSSLVMSGSDNKFSVSLAPSEGFEFSSVPLEITVSLSSRRRPKYIDPKPHNEIEFLSSKIFAPHAESASFEVFEMPNLPLLRRVEDFKWNPFHSDDCSLQSGAHDAVIVEVQSVPSVFEPDVDHKIPVGYLTLRLETLAHLTDLSMLCNPPKSSWKKLMASPLLYFVGTAYISEHCCSCHFPMKLCNCQTAQVVEQKSFEVFRTCAKPIREMIESCHGAPLDSSFGISPASDVFEGTLDLTGIEDIYIKMPYHGACERNINRILRHSTLTVSIHVRYDWSLFADDDQDAVSTNLQKSFEGILPIADSVLGGVAVDLFSMSILEQQSQGVVSPAINGWYHIIDDAQKCHGQLKLSISAPHGADADTFLKSKQYFKVDIDDAADVDVDSLKRKLDESLSIMNVSSRKLAEDGYSIENVDFLNKSMMGNTSCKGDVAEEEDGITGYFRSLHDVDGTSQDYDTRALETELSSNIGSNVALDEANHSRLSVIAGVLEDDSWGGWVPAIDKDSGNTSPGAVSGAQLFRSSLYISTSSEQKSNFSALRTLEMDLSGAEEKGSVCNVSDQQDISVDLSAAEENRSVCSISDEEKSAELSAAEEKGSVCNISDEQEISVDLSAAEEKGSVCNVSDQQDISVDFSAAEENRSVCSISDEEKSVDLTAAEEKGSVCNISDEQEISKYESELALLMDNGLLADAKTTSFWRLFEKGRKYENKITSESDVLHQNDYDDKYDAHGIAHEHMSESKIENIVTLICDGGSESSSPSSIHLANFSIASAEVPYGSESNDISECNDAVEDSTVSSENSVFDLLIDAGISVLSSSRATPEFDEAEFLVNFSTHLGGENTVQSLESSDVETEGLKESITVDKSEMNKNAHVQSSEIPQIKNEEVDSKMRIVTRFKEQDEIKQIKSQSKHLAPPVVDVASLVRHVMSKYDAPTSRIGISTASPLDNPNSFCTDFPGRRRQFVESETSRISMIMLGGSATQR